MDGSNVNLKFLYNLQHVEIHWGQELIFVWSCRQQTFHNSLKTCVSAWNIRKQLRAMQFVFHNVPARWEMIQILPAAHEDPPDLSQTCFFRGKIQNFSFILEEIPDWWASLAIFVQRWWKLVKVEFLFNLNGHFIMNCWLCKKPVLTGIAKQVNKMFND